MAYFEVADFKAGVDVRRSRYTSVPGTLQKLVNAHITRGGDVERRKAFVPSGTFGANTFGLEADVDGLVTFGSAASHGGLPAGVRYQRLQAPSGADMVSIDAIEQFGGRLYVAATFSDSVQWHFYDGEVVGDWGAGIARAYMSDNAGIAESLLELINAGGIYTATRSGSVLTITGPDGVDFEVEGTTENRDGGNPNQNLVVSNVQDPVAAVADKRAVGAFAIVAGKGGAGNSIQRVTVRYSGIAIQLLGNPVDFVINTRMTAAAVAAEINLGSHGYRARAEYGSVIIEAAPTSNGRTIEVEVEGEVCLAEASFAVTAGSGSSDQLITVHVDGKPVTGDPVEWATSNTATAAAVAAEINAYSSSPKMVATAIGATVYLAPKVVRSDDPSEVTVLVTTDGDFGSGDGAPPPEGPPGGGGGGYDPRPDPGSELNQVR